MATAKNSGRSVPRKRKTALVYRYWEALQALLWYVGLLQHGAEFDLPTWRQIVFRYNRASVAIGKEIDLSKPVWRAVHHLVSQYVDRVDDALDLGMPELHCLGNLECAKGVSVLVEAHFLFVLERLERSGTSDYTPATSDNAPYVVFTMRFSRGFVHFAINGTTGQLGFCTGSLRISRRPLIACPEGSLYHRRVSLSECRPMSKRCSTDARLAVARDCSRACSRDLAAAPRRAENQTERHPMMSLNRRSKTRPESLVR